MPITVTYYDSEAEKSITSDKFPETMSGMWTFVFGLDTYVPNRATIKITQGNHYLTLALYTGYHRCCGMREFGAVSFNWDCTEGAKKALVAELFNQKWFNNQRIGALLYTKVKHSDDSPADQYGWDFVDNWPGTVTEGGWWYNPNSGNYCCNVTLSFDAEAAVEEDAEESYDYEEED